MAGTHTLFMRLRLEWEQWRSAQSLRFDEMQTQLEEFAVRLDKYDKPAQNQTVSAKEAKGRAKPIPVPKRPEVMEASGVGEDPR